MVGSSDKVYMLNNVIWGFKGILLTRALPINAIKEHLLDFLSIPFDLRQLFSTNFLVAEWDNQFGDHRWGVKFYRVAFQVSRKRFGDS